MNVTRINRERQGRIETAGETRTNEVIRQWRESVNSLVERLQNGEEVDGLGDEVSAAYRLAVELENAELRA